MCDYVGPISASFYELFNQPVVSQIHTQMKKCPATQERAIQVEILAGQREQISHQILALLDNGAD